MNKKPKTKHLIVQTLDHFPLLPPISRVLPSLMYFSIVSGVFFYYSGSPHCLLFASSPSSVRSVFHRAANLRSYITFSHSRNNTCVIFPSPDKKKEGPSNHVAPRASFTNSMRSLAVCSLPDRESGIILREIPYLANSFLGDLL